MMDSLISILLTREVCFATKKNLSILIYYNISDVVWGQDKQMALIESLFRNFYVPPVLFFIDDTKKEEKGVDGPIQVCMDGKQRLSSIVSFLDGQVSKAILLLNCTRN